MKITRIDKLGRIVVPITFRRQLKICEGDELLVRIEEESVIITTTKKRCKVCEVGDINNKTLPICDRCISIIKQNFN